MRGGEPTAMACVSSVVPRDPSAGHGREGAQEKRKAHTGVMSRLAQDDRILTTFA
jgi:hypothetical protein